MGTPAREAVLQAMTDALSAPTRCRFGQAEQIAEVPLGRASQICGCLAGGQKLPQRFDLGGFRSRKRSKKFGDAATRDKWQRGPAYALNS